MRCDDVIHELAAPTGDVEASALAGHLADCPDCAAWARSADAFDRLWQATTPPSPSAEARATAWATIAEALDASPARGAAPARRWRRAAAATIGVAQAAVLLIGAFLLSRAQPTRPLDTLAQATPTRAVAPIEIPPGEPVIIRPDGHVEALAVAEDSDAVDPYLVMLNTVEAMAPVTLAQHVHPGGEAAAPVP